LTQLGASTKEVSLPETRKGLIIVYTGPGKGKTTAALGTALRCVGQGLRVLMVQFIKGSWHYGELEAAHLLGEERFKILPMGRGFVKVGAEKPDPEDIRLAREAWEFARENILGGQYDLVILDEINYVISYKMLDAEGVVEALKIKPQSLHVLLTGRNAHPAIVELADLVTEMREVKHPYQKGISAQRGIEY
jgi:cob(I)alamin adenosyltransferase